MNKEAFGRLSTGFCFWCESVIFPDEANRDHLIAAAIGGTWDADNIVISCVGCNLERGVITSLFIQMDRVPGWEWERNRDANLRILHKYRRLVEEKLDGYTQEVCLQEIDEVLSSECDF